MSASLVGSEMCIRDRCWEGEACPHRLGAADQARCDAAGGLEVREHRRCAVSYTHLTLPTICSV
eukprot:9300378-Alexandrium_andersonii.AAC.1